MPLSPVVFRIEIKDFAVIPKSFVENMIGSSLPNSNSSNTNVDDTQIINRGQREFKQISLETFHNEAIAASDDASQKIIPFTCGNPFVEKTEGILHLYKSNAVHQGNPGLTDLCMLAVPSFLPSPDLLQFLKPYIAAIRHIRIVRDSSPNAYIVLLSFRYVDDANQAYKALNGQRFNSIEPDRCSLAYLAKVEVINESLGGSDPVPGHTELPVCPVCLERMDESVDGVLTVICNHSFHTSCMSQWGDTTCPVCRHCQTPEALHEHRCQTCNQQQDLWICLVCGNIGCGRYLQAHAQKHFVATGHCFALQVGGQRVWDYAGDNYVHRLALTGSEPHKPVAVGEGGAEEEKMDALTLEFSHLLSRQLDAQRQYFEEKIAVAEKRALTQTQDVEQQLRQTIEECKKLRDEHKDLIADLKNKEKRLTQATQRLQTLENELSDEREMSKGVRDTHALCTEKRNELLLEYRRLRDDKDKEIAELKHQLRDLMLHLDAENRVQKLGAENSTMVLAESSSGPSLNKSKSKKKH